jgi:DNA-binding transcriptional MerR regulator
MKTVNEVSRLTGVSVRALHYYDRIGLLRPTEVTEAGYRLYGSEALERLQDILLFRELEFPLREIQKILDSPDFDRSEALGQQIELLSLKRARLEGIIALARRIKESGGKTMDFEAFDREKIEEYAAEAKKRWGGTAAYREYEQKSAGRSAEDTELINGRLMSLFAGLGKLRGGEASSAAAQAQIQALRDFITENFYECTPEILSGLGKMYGAGGEFTENIDRAGGPGTAAFAEKAIEYYCIYCAK